MTITIFDMLEKPVLRVAIFHLSSVTCAFKGLDNVFFFKRYT